MAHLGPNCSEGGQIVAQECYIREGIRHGCPSPVDVLELTERFVKICLFF